MDVQKLSVSRSALQKSEHGTEKFVIKKEDWSFAPPRSENNVSQAKGPLLSRKWSHFSKNLERTKLIWYSQLSLN